MFQNGYSKYLSANDSGRQLNEYKEENTIGCSPFIEMTFYNNQTPVIPLFKRMG